MAYSIITKDGIEIKNIPDDVDPNSQELKDRIAELRAQRDAKPEPSALDKAKGYGETALTMATSALAEPLSGLAGIAAMVPGGKTPTEAIKEARDGLTYTPKTAAGQESLAAVGEALAPVGEALSGTEDFLGDAMFKATGSPALAALAKSAPTAVLELFGVAGARAATKTSRLGRQADELIQQNPLSPEQLQSASRAVFKEMDDLGATVDPKIFSNFVDEVADGFKERNYNPKLHNKAKLLLKEMRQMQGRTDITPSDFDSLRALASDVMSIKKNKRFGGYAIDAIDDFFANNGTAFNSPVDIGARYSVARQLWARAKKTELMDDIIENAQGYSSGAAKGVKSQVESILKNKHKRRFFTADEVSELQKIAVGSKVQGAAEVLATLSKLKNPVVSGGIGAASVVGPSYGAGLLGAGVAGRKIAESLAKTNATRGRNILAGNAQRSSLIDYLKNTPAKERSREAITQILLQQR